MGRRKKGKGEGGGGCQAPSQPPRVDPGARPDPLSLVLATDTYLAALGAAQAALARGRIAVARNRYVARDGGPRSLCADGGPRSVAAQGFREALAHYGRAAEAKAEMLRALEAIEAQEDAAEDARTAAARVLNH
jgi:hypothetical protein